MMAKTRCTACGLSTAREACDNACACNVCRFELDTVNRLIPACGSASAIILTITEWWRGAPDEMRFSRTATAQEEGECIMNRKVEGVPASGDENQESLR